MTIEKPQVVAKMRALLLGEHNLARTTVRMMAMLLHPLKPLPHPLPHLKVRKLVQAPARMMVAPLHLHNTLTLSNTKCSR